MNILEAASGSRTYCELGAILAKPAAYNIANTGINFFISSLTKPIFKRFAVTINAKRLLVCQQLHQYGGSYASTKITSPVIKPSTERSNALPTSLLGTG